MSQGIQLFGLDVYTDTQAKSKELVKVQTVARRLPSHHAFRR